jgi:hypothetical protein
MYTRDQEALHHRLATEAALEEAEVPAEYLRKAERELRIRQAARQRWRQIAIGLPLALLPVVGLLLFLALRPPSHPIAETFDDTAELRWTLEANPGTSARADFDRGYARITVNRFAPSVGGPLPGRHWATLRTIDGDKDVRTLEALTFRARGQGLDRLRFRFVRGSRSWVTPAFLVGSDWKTYRVPLNHLDQFRQRGDTEKSDGAFDDRPQSTVSEIQIQTGSHVNPVEARGTLEIDDVAIR